MSTLYIANTTKQNHSFAYRAPETNQLRYQDIPIGQQARIPGDLTLGAIEGIIRQHLPYGLVKAEEAHKQRGFRGLCYRIDAPIELETFGVVLEQNDASLTERSEQRREATATAIAEANRRLAAEAEQPLLRTEVETIDETKDRAPALATGYEVPSDGVAPRRGKQRRTK